MLIKTCLKKLMFSLLAMVILTSASGCGFRLQGSYSIPEELQTLSVESSDKYSELSRLVHERLRLNNIQIVETTEGIPRIFIRDDTLDRSTLSLYPTGNVAEYELIYQVGFSVFFPKEEAQSFDIELRRNYLDDPRTALAKSREMELLLKEMRDEAADNILQILATIKVD